MRGSPHERADLPKVHWPLWVEIISYLVDERLLDFILDISTVPVAWTSKFVTEYLESLQVIFKNRQKRFGTLFDAMIKENGEIWIMIEEGKRKLDERNRQIYFDTFGEEM